MYDARMGISTADRVAGGVAVLGLALGLGSSGCFTRLADAGEWRHSNFAFAAGELAAGAAASSMIAVESNRGSDEPIGWVGTLAAGMGVAVAADAAVALTVWAVKSSEWWKKRH